MNEKTKKILSIILRVIISFCLLAFIFSKVDKEKFIETIRLADPALLVSALLLLIFCYILGLFRWEMLLKGAKVHLPFRKIMYGFCGGLFFNLFLPSTIGGDIVRGFDLAKHSRKPKEVVASVLLDRLSGYIALVTIALVALCVGYQYVIQERIVIVIVVGIAALLAAIMAVLFNNFLFGKLNKLFHSPAGNKVLLALKDVHQEMYYFRHHKKIVFSNLALSLLIQSCFPLVFYLVAKAVGVELEPIYFFIFVPIINTISFLPISIGGLGLRDGTTIFFFAKVGLLKDVSLAISLIVFTYILFIGCVGGIIYVLTLRTRRLQHNQES